MSCKTDRVIVYGLECPVYSINPDESVAMILEDLEAASKKDVIRIMSGEANAELYNQVEDVMRKNCTEKELSFEIIAGPILSVKLDNGQRRNAIVDMAKLGFFDLFLSKIRRELHFRTVGERLLRGELPHFPITYDGRFGYKIDTHEFLTDDKKKQAVFAIENRIRDFEAAKMFCEHVPASDIEKSFVLLSNEEIVAVSQAAQRMGLSIDRLSREQIQRILSINDATA